MRRHLDHVPASSEEARGGRPAQIPDVRRQSDALAARPGWQVVAVPGMVPDEVFLDHLANRPCPAGHFIRGAGQFDCLQEPDVFHDVLGHVPLLLRPVDGQRHPGLQRARSGSGRSRTWPACTGTRWSPARGGAGRSALLRCRHCLLAHRVHVALDDASAHRIRLHLERVMCTRHRIDVQETDFVLADLLQLARIDFGPLHERVRIGLTHEPGTMMDADHFVHRGTSSYHRTAGRGPGKEAP